MLVREELEKIGKEATKYLRELRENPSSTQIIGYHNGDTTRVADKRSEDYIFELLKTTGHNFLFVSEESGAVKTSENYDYIAIIDPLDGSSNYVAGIPWSSVSIALYDKNTQSFLDSSLGVVAEVFGNNIYSYDLNGAYKNGQLVEKSNKKPANIAIIYYEREQINKISQILAKLGKIKIRSLGSASLDMIKVCLGDAIFFADLRKKLRNVDIAASSSFCKRLSMIPLDERGRPIENSLTTVSEFSEVYLSTPDILYNILKDL